MTVKYYYSSPYMKKWKTSIEEIKEQEGKLWVCLKETAFYPEGGGQPADNGKINDISVLDVQLIGNKVWHALQEKPQSEEVNCELNWTRRLDHMQQHTAQHLLSAVLYELYDSPTVSFHLGKDYTTIDIDCFQLTDEQKQLVENKCNQYIQENHSINTYLVSEEESLSLPLKKRPKVEGEIRIVEIKGIDYSACAGTHVKSTGELGLLKIIKTETHKKKKRLFFLSGKRAFLDYQQSQQILDHLSYSFQTNKNQLLERIEKLEQEKRGLNKALEKSKIENTVFLSRQLLENNEHPILFHQFDDKPMKDIQVLANQLLLEAPNRILLFATDLDNKVLLQHNGEFSIHCGTFIKNCLQQVNGKGGGSQKVAQATISTNNELHVFLNGLKSLLDDSLDKLYLK